MLRIGVVLSGSGVCDGSEIHESVLALLAIDRAGAQAVCMAPNKNQSEVINHATGQVSNESRNVLVESARIARGNIRDIREVSAADLDAVILPGGYGAVKNLSNFCWSGERAWVDGEVFRLLRDMFAARKPIGATCIAPAILAKVFSAEKPKLTIGTDAGTAEVLGRMGAEHEDAQADEIVVDERLQIVTTPAYMVATRLTELQSGIERLVDAVARRAAKRAREIADSAASAVPQSRHPADSATASISRRTRRQAADSAAARVVTSKTARASRPQAARRRTVRA